MNEINTSFNMCTTFLNELAEFFCHARTMRQIGKQWKKLPKKLPNTYQIPEIIELGEDNWQH